MANEKRLIDANALKAVLKSEECNCEVFPWAVDNAPTVDAVEVVHGEWVIDRSPVEAEFRCSECDFSYIEADSYAKAEYNYCPNCGAKMDGERKTDG